MDEKADVESILDSSEDSSDEDVFSGDEQFDAIVGLNVDTHKAGTFLPENKAASKGALTARHGRSFQNKNPAEAKWDLTKINENGKPRRIHTEAQKAARYAKKKATRALNSEFKKGLKAGIKTKVAKVKETLSSKYHVRS